MDKKATTQTALVVLRQLLTSLERADEEEIAVETSVRVSALRKLVDALQNGHELTETEQGLWYKARNVCDAYEKFAHHLQMPPEVHFEQAQRRDHGVY